MFQYEAYGRQAMQSPCKGELGSEGWILPVNTISWARREEKERQEMVGKMNDSVKEKGCLNQEPWKREK